VHLVGFTIEVYWDARSYKRQIIRQIIKQYRDEGKSNIRIRSFYFEYKHMTVGNTWVKYRHTLSLLFGVVTTSVTAIIALVVPRVNDASCRTLRPFFNPLNAALNPICYFLALLGAHLFLHVSRIRVKSLTFRLLMSYIYGAPILDVSRSHTTTHHSR